MLSNEGAKEMCIWFIEIVSYLKSLRKIHSNEEMVRKLVRSCPRNQWGDKVIATEEAQNLKALKLENFVGKLFAYEIHL